MKIEGAGNFRSLGGLAAQDGRRIRAHFLMRSDRLCDLNAADWDALASTGLMTICDLRSREECTQHPNCVPGALAVQEIACDVRNDLRGDASLMSMLLEQPDEAGAERLMIEIYRRLPRHMGPVLARIGEVLLAGGAPLLIHCTAGKDRTGFAVAVLLQALGVSRDEIDRDYLLSREWTLAPLHRAALGRRFAATVPPEAVDSVVTPLLDVRPSYLQAAFDVIHSEYGSPENYLATVCSLDASAVGRLRTLALI